MQLTEEAKSDALDVSTSHPVRIALKLSRCLLRCACEYLLYRVGFRERFCWQEMRRLNERQVKTLLRGFSADLRTCLYRVEKRIDRFPDRYAGHKGLPIYVLNLQGELVECARTRAYSIDTRNYQMQHREASVFDVETYFAGWEMGERYGLHSLELGTADSKENAMDQVLRTQVELPELLDFSGVVSDNAQIKSLRRRFGSPQNVGIRLLKRQAQYRWWNVVLTLGYRFITLAGDRYEGRLRQYGHQMVRAAVFHLSRLHSMECAISHARYKRVQSIYDRAFSEAQHATD